MAAVVVVRGRGGSGGGELGIRGRHHMVLTLLTICI